MSSLSQILRDVDIFNDLGLEQLQAIEAIGQERMYQEGDVIFKENTTSNELYVILNGQVEILVDPDTLRSEADDSTGLKTIATLRRGMSFGEVALVDQGLRSASAMAVKKDTRLLVIPEQKFNHLCRDNFELGYKVMRNIAADLAFKLRQTDIMVQEQVVWGNR